jgi:hypothetical protein
MSRGRAARAAAAVSAAPMRTDYSRFRARERRRGQRAVICRILGLFLRLVRGSGRGSDGDQCGRWEGLDDQAQGPQGCRCIYLAPDLVDLVRGDAAQLGGVENAQESWLAVKASPSSACRWNSIPRTKMGSRMLAACDTTQAGNLAFGVVGSTRPPRQPCFTERQYSTHRPRARPPSRPD